MKRKAISFLLISYLTIGFIASSKGAAEGTAVNPDRPIWLWGVPGGSGEYTPESLELANRWAQNMFGHTFRLSGIPYKVTHLDAINLMIAEGRLPDSIWLGWDYGVAEQKLIVDLAKSGKSMAVDQYYNDPKNYPTLFQVGRVKDQIYGLTWKGRMYASPAYYTALPTSPSYAGIEWWIRWDALRGYKGNTLDHQAWVPRTLEDVHMFAKYADGLGLLDHNGQSSYAFGISFYSNKPEEWTRVLKTLKGAGWEVDKQMRLLPFWASEEMHDALAWVNMMYREGLMCPDFVKLDGRNNIQHRSSAMPIIHAGMENWGPALHRREIYEEVGGDFEEAARHPSWNRFYMCIVPPIVEPDGNVGAFYTRFPTVTITMKTCPNPDALFRLFDWCFTAEAVPTMRLNYGPKDVNWEWVPEDLATQYDPPMKWRIVGYDEPVIRDEDGAVDWLATYLRLSPCPDKIAFDGAMSISQAQDCPPRVLPWIIMFAFPTYTHYAEKNYWHGLYMDFVEMKVPIDGREATWTATCTDWELHHLIKDTIESPKPSYSMVLYDLTPREIDAFVTAEQRFNESLAQILTAETTEVFDAEYAAMLKKLMKVTDWKVIFEKKQRYWEEWMASNQVDDRDQLKTVRPRPEWIEALGWR